jgi:hypothetical protein
MSSFSKDPAFTSSHLRSEYVNLVAHRLTGVQKSTQMGRLSKSIKDSSRTTFLCFPLLFSSLSSKEMVEVRLLLVELGDRLSSFLT